MRKLRDDLSILTYFTMEALQDELKRYPSSFSIVDDIRAISNGDKIKLKDKLLVELCSLKNEFSTSMEKIRVWNLLSFLYFVLGDRKTANKYNWEVLNESQNNIIALTNSAWFSFKDRRNVKVCEVTLKRLKALKSDRLAYVVGKAELAFTYSRFGLKQYRNAISLFSEITEEIRSLLEEQMQNPNHDTPADETIKKHLVELKCVWTYGYAMTLQRLTHVSNTSEEGDMDTLRKRHSTVFELYGEIFKLESKSECIQRYKARALVEAGLLAYGVNRNICLFPQGMKGLLPRQSPIFMPTYMYFNTALKMFPNDTFVLERSGKYYRYVDDIERSILLLNRAIEIKGTSFAYHHLAVSYIRMLEYNPGKLRHLLSLTEQAREKHTPVSHHEITEISSTAEADSEKCDFVSVIDMATKFYSEKYHLQTAPINNCSTPAIVNTPNSKTSGGNSEEVYNQVPIKSNESKVQQEEHPTTNTDLKSQLNPMAECFVPRRQHKQNETLPQNLTAAHERFSGKNEPRAKVCASNVPQLFTPAVNSNVYKRNKNDKHMHENSNIRKPPSYYTIERHRGNWRYGSFNKSYIENVNDSQRNSQNAQRVKQRNMPDTYNMENVEPKIHYVGKCFRYPRQIDYEIHKQVVDIAISHLDMSTNISSNKAALYDKAILYRQTKQNDKALEILQSLMQNDDDLCSNFLLANAYEQAAFCVTDLIDSQEIVGGEKTQQLIDDRQFYLKSSIEISCNIIAKHPYLGHCWRSAQTLRQILLCESETKRTKETLQDLWFLYNKINNNSGVIEVLIELKELSEDDAEKKEIIEEIVRKYLFVENYEEAVIALCMLNRLNDNSCGIDQSLYVQVYIEAGLDAFKRKHLDQARLRIRKAFEYQEREEDTTDHVSSLSVERDERYDLFILSNLDDEVSGRDLMLLLNSLGLHTTFNTDSLCILPGTPEVDGMTKVMHISKAFVILLNFDVEDKKMQHIVDRMQIIVEERAEESFIAVITNPKTDIPSTCRLTAYKRFVLDLGNIQELGMENEDTYRTIKSLLFAMTAVLRHA